MGEGRQRIHSAKSFQGSEHHISQAFEGEHKNQGEGSQLINR